MGASSKSCHQNTPFSLRSRALDWARAQTFPALHASLRVVLHCCIAVAAGGLNWQDLVTVL